MGRGPRTTESHVCYTGGGKLGERNFLACGVSFGQEVGLLDYQDGYFFAGRKADATADLTPEGDEGSKCSEEESDESGQRANDGTDDCNPWYMHVMSDLSVLQED